jgi:hypothetical protein
MREETGIGCKVEIKNDCFFFMRKILFEKVSLPSRSRASYYFTASLLVFSLLFRVLLK